MKYVWCNNSVYDGIERTCKIKRKNLVLTDLNHLRATHFLTFRDPCFGHRWFRIMITVAAPAHNIWLIVETIIASYTGVTYHAEHITPKARHRTEFQSID